MKLKTKLFLGFATLVVASGMLFTAIGVWTLDHRVTGEAQNLVRADLRGAWAEVNNELDGIEAALAAVADSPSIVEFIETEAWQNPSLARQLERARLREGLDFLEIVSAEGIVVMRSHPPQVTGVSRLGDASVIRAMQGRPATALSALSATELARSSGEALESAASTGSSPAEQGRGQDEPEARGMAMVAAVPVTRGQEVLAIIHGGVLLNDNHGLIDHIHDAVYQDKTYEGRQLGNATIFLGDRRIATTVRYQSGARATGTLASEEVASRVLGSGLPWVDKALVIGVWHLTAYEPIRDGLGQVIGMLSVGILKAPYDDAADSVVWNFVLMSVLILFLALGIAFRIAGRLARPIQRLEQASDRMRHGHTAQPVPTDGACRETENLIESFNDMASTLMRREKSLKVLNRSYMETLGFVSHELRNPVASIVNYGYLLRQNALGELNDMQREAVEGIETGAKRLTEMVQHYLNLSRIENGEFEPVFGEVHLMSDVLTPVLGSLAADVEAREMKLDSTIDDEIVLNADESQLREVFENLIGNAIKYGRDGGRITITSTVLDDAIEFRVWNEGRGFPEDEVGRLFRKFSRLEETSKLEKGTGLGLFITKQIVEAHGGGVGAKSKLGEWAEFSFTLPLSRAQSGEGRHENSQSCPTPEESTKPGLVA